MSYLGYNPIFGSPMARDMTASEFRAAAPGSPWRYDPWTGHQRLEDMVADPYGHGIEKPEDADPWMVSMQDMADAVPLGMQSIHDRAVNTLALGLAQKIDLVIRKGLDRTLGEGWTMESLSALEMSAVHSKDGTTIYRLGGVEFLLIRETKLLPSTQIHETRVGFEFRFLGDSARVKSASQNEPELSMSMFASQADFDAAKAAQGRP